MTRPIERSIPWPSALERQRLPKLEKFLREEGLCLDSTVPHGELELIRRFFRLRQLVGIGVIEPTVAAKRFSRAVEKRGINNEDFYEKYRIIFQTITAKIPPPPWYRS